MSAAGVLLSLPHLIFSNLLTGPTDSMLLLSMLVQIIFPSEAKPTAIPIAWEELEWYMVREEVIDALLQRAFVITLVPLALVVLYSAFGALPSTSCLLWMEYLCEEYFHLVARRPLRWLHLILGEVT